MEKNNQNVKSSKHPRLWLLPGLARRAHPGWVWATGQAVASRGSRGPRPRYQETPGPLLG